MSQPLTMEARLYHLLQDDVPRTRQQLREALQVDDRAGEKLLDLALRPTRHARERLQAVAESLERLARDLAIDAQDARKVAREYLGEATRSVANEHAQQLEGYATRAAEVLRRLRVGVADERQEG